MNIKRIIAREGLIIIAIGLLAVGVHYLRIAEDARLESFSANAIRAEIVRPNVYDVQGALKAGYTEKEITDYVASKGYRVNVKYGNKKTDADGIVWDHAKPFIQEMQVYGRTGIYVMYPKHTSPSGVENIAKQFSHIPNAQAAVCNDWWKCYPVSRFYGDNGKPVRFYNDKHIVIYALLLYPTYLLGRFIWWAIRTLRT